MVSPGTSAQLNWSAESALGTPSGSFYSARVAGALPNFPSVAQYVDNHVAGHQHPLTVEKPEAITLCVENAFSFDAHIRRAAANGGKPDLMTWIESAGWKVNASTGATTLTGTPTVSELIQASNVTAAGQFILVERSTGVYVPVLVSTLSTATVVPHVRLSAAPATGAAVHPMHTATPTSATAFTVAADKTLSWRMNTHAKYDDAYSDMALDMKACALASIGEISIDKVGGTIIIPTTWHGVPVAYSADDIAADVFVDSSQFALPTDDMEISIQAADAAGNIALVSGTVVNLKVNPGVATMPIYGTGGGTVGGITGYQCIPTNPTIDVTMNFTGLSTWDKDLLVQLMGSNVSKAIQILQPTRDLDRAAFAIAMPNCHQRSGMEPKIVMGQNTIQITAGFVASTAGINSETLITEEGTAPIYIGISGEAAA
jgi:hypothetical protein